MGHEGHDHDHEHVVHDTPHGDHAPRRTLPRGFGHGKVVFFDAPSGLAGDMTIAALVDLGVPPHALEESWHALPVDAYHVHFSSKTCAGVVATHFDVHVGAHQPERTFASIRALLERASLAPGVKARALRTFARLAEAEARVHATTVDDVHFHEVGAVDAIVDIVGAAAALEYLGAEVVVSPLPIGRGYVKAAHGVLPLPPPAVVDLLQGWPTYDAGIDRELVTPTGAAIIAANAARAERWPAMRVGESGWGAGTMDLPDRPNLLRVVLGEPTVDAASATHVVLEANLDDATGEVLAAAIETLLAEGALDAWAAPLTMKKGRPGVMLGVLCDQARADALAAVVLRETPTLGVRSTPVRRVERPRRMVSVETTYGKLPVKVAEGPFGPPQVKPEYDACAAAAHAHGVPVRVVMAAALVAAHDLIKM